MIYLGLTDDPARERAAHGNPSTWQSTPAFLTEAAARSWLQRQLAMPGATGGAGDTGWRYGYWFMVRSDRPWQDVGWPSDAL